MLRVMIYACYAMLAFTAAATVYDSYLYLFGDHGWLHLFLVSLNIFICRLWLKWLREYKEEDS